MKKNPSLLIVMLAALVASGAFFVTNHVKTPPAKASLSDEELLGKNIFEDINLSEPKGTSCASCHEASRAFQGNNTSPIGALAKGSKPDSFGTRNTPTLMYMAFSPAFYMAEEKNEKGETEYTPTGGHFWDGRADSFMAQAQEPLLNHREMNNGTKEVVVKKVAAASYAPLMKKIYGATVFNNTDQAFEKIMTALAVFENSAGFAPFSSQFDRYLEGKGTLTPLEMEGFALFKDPEKGNCIACHVGKEDSKNPRDWLFTDFTYDNLGVPRNPKIPDNSKADYYDLGLCQQKDIAKKLPKAVDVNSLCGAFKVPTLRNVAITAPYMHNGFFTNLRDVVAFYATRDIHPDLWYPKDDKGGVKLFDDLPQAYHAHVNVGEAPYDRKKGEAPRLNDHDIDALVAFLKTLTDEGMQ